MSDSWFLYLLRTDRGSLYTGIATDVERRLEQHRAGRGAKALRGASELSVAYRVPVQDRSTALRLEARVKRSSKQIKEALVRSRPGDEDAVVRFLDGETEG